MNTFGEPSVYYELGQLGVSWARVQAMIRDLHTEANAKHVMGAEAKTPIISDTAQETGRRLCYNSGTDGGDSRLWIEDTPSHHVDWDCTEEEWEELCCVLWYSLGPYARKLRKAGKLGRLPPVARS